MHVLPTSDIFLQVYKGGTWTSTKALRPFEYLHMNDKYILDILLYSQGRLRLFPTGELWIYWWGENCLIFKFPALRKEVSIYLSSNKDISIYFFHTIIKKKNSVQLYLYLESTLFISSTIFSKNRTKRMKKTHRDFPGCPVVKNPPVNDGDTGLIPGPGRFHMSWSN